MGFKIKVRGTDFNHRIITQKQDRRGKISSLDTTDFIKGGQPDKTRTEQMRNAFHGQDSNKSLIKKHRSRDI